MKWGQGWSLAPSEMQAQAGAAEHTESWRTQLWNPTLALLCVALSPWAGRLAFLSLGLPAGGDRSPFPVASVRIT